VLHCDPETKSLERPFVVRFDHCTDVAVHDVSLRHPCLKAASIQTTTTGSAPVLQTQLLLCSESKARKGAISVTPILAIPVVTSSGWGEQE